MTKRGRPKKKNAVKAGELKNNLCRFSFIAEKEIVALIKKKANKEGQTIKDYMHEILTNSLGVANEDKKQITPPTIIPNNNKLVVGNTPENQAKLDKYLIREKAKTQN